MDSAVQVELQRQTKVIKKGASFAVYSICTETGEPMIRKLASGQYRLYSKKKDKSGKRKNLGTFKSLAAAKKHERAVQYFKSA